MEQRERIAPFAGVEEGQANQSSVVEELESGHAFGWAEATRILFVGLAAVAVRLHLGEPLAGVSLPGILGVLIGGWPIFTSASEDRWCPSSRSASPPTGNSRPARHWRLRP